MIVNGTIVGMESRKVPRNYSARIFIIKKWELGISGRTVNRYVVYGVISKEGKCYP